MKRATGKRSLEAYKIFPYVAWGLTVVFAIFVYNITKELQAVTTSLQQQTNALEQQINNGNTSEADFDAYQRERYGNQTDTQ